MGRRVLIVATSMSTYGDRDKPTGLWFGELTHFVDAIEAAGHTWDLASPHGGNVPIEPRSLGGLYMKSGDRKHQADPAFMARLETSRPTADVDSSDYDAIYYTGGHGTMWDFPDDEHLQRICAHIHADGGYVSAVCHGVTGLLNVERADGTKLIAGKEVTGYSDVEEVLAGVKRLVPYSLEDELRRRGATYKRAFLPFTSYVRVDDRIVTGQNPQSARATGERLAHLLS